MPNVLDTQLRSLHPKQLKKFNMVLADRRLKVQEMWKAFHMAQWFRFWIITLVQESYLQDGCLVCSQLQSCDNFEGEFDIVQLQYGQVLRHFVTVDKTWIHRNTPETMQQSKQWPSLGKLAPKKAKVNLSANKVMATVFRDTHGIIHIDYPQMGRTLNGEYYANLLDQLNDDLKKKDCIWPRKKFFSTKIMQWCTYV